MSESTDVNTAYSQLHKGLSEVRELFHREGRFNDSNAKLDETVKFLSINYEYQTNGIEKSKYQKLLNKDTFSVEGLQDVFNKAVNSKTFTMGDGKSVFGPDPKIAFRKSEKDIAYELFITLHYSVEQTLQNGNSIDLLNEAFGHFVRDNFRNHIEDAQYMTPIEVVSFMANLAKYHIEGNNKFEQLDEFIMMDPSCGVGSFLNTWSNVYKTFKSKGITDKLKLIGQDKVERMSRLSSINMIFSGYDPKDIYLGNSLLDGSPLDEWNGQVDLILTNPPFGAKFPAEKISELASESTPIFANSRNSSEKYIESELLFIDRYLRLLKEGGICLAIVPDSVISSRGRPAFLRQKILDKSKVHAVIELPAVTFAQAGTRTKTSILFLEKKQSDKQDKNNVYFSEVHDVGFEVSKRKGVPIKKSNGVNQLPQVLENYKSLESTSYGREQQELMTKWSTLNLKKYDSWTPRKFAIDTDKIANDINSQNTRLIQLNELVQKPEKRKKIKWKPGRVFISVKHIIGDGLYDIQGMFEHQPVTPGTPVNPGEIIISLINPRIPRVMVVPDLDAEIICSSEFEVLKPQQNVSTFELSFLLLTEAVQKQIQSLTSGTSASHARVKSDDLYEIMIPWQVEKNAEFKKTIKVYERNIKSIIKSTKSIQAIRNNYPSM